MAGQAGNRMTAFFISSSSLGLACAAFFGAMVGLAGVASLSAAAQIADTAAQNDVIRMPKSWPALVAANKLNVRGGPGDNYKVVETLELGATVNVIGQSGTWIRLDRPVEAWVARVFLKLPPDFLTPLFDEADNAFLDWAAGTGLFEEVSVEGDGRLAVVMSPSLYGDRAKLEQVARDAACMFRERTKYAGAVSLTVWAQGGPAAGLVHQVQCQ